jgi:MFS family permease
MFWLAVSSSPNLHGLPGSNVLQKLIDGSQGWGLALSLLGLFVGMALWGVASHAHNPHQAMRGRSAALVSAAAALAIGAGPALVNFFSGLGQQAK